MADAPLLKIKLQIMCGSEIAMGPGKADLLEAIDREGSISGAGRALGMSYRRAWSLVDVMNRCWHEPLVAALPGGSAASGAQITPLGRKILHHYRSLQAHTVRAAESADWAEMERNILAKPKSQQNG